MQDTIIILGKQGIANESKTIHAGLYAQDPFTAGRHIAFRDGHGFASGHVVAEGSFALTNLRHAEVMTLVSGAISLGNTIYKAGEALVLPKGFSGILSCSPQTCWFYCVMYSGEAGVGHEAIRLDATLPRPESPGPAQAVLIGHPPQCHALNLFTDPTGMRAGVWDVSTPCERNYVPHKVNELMHVIEGEMIMTHRNGTSVVVKAGDAIFVPKEAPYAWKSRVKVVKYYCVM